MPPKGIKKKPAIAKKPANAKAKGQAKGRAMGRPNNVIRVDVSELPADLRNMVDQMFASAEAIAKRPAAAEQQVAAAQSRREEKALEVCRRLTDGELKLEDLGKTPETRGYVLLRDVAPQWLAKNKQELRGFYQYGTDNVLTEIAHTVSVMIDGGGEWDDLDKICKILFSDKTDTQFFTLGVENGHFIRDAANQFREYLHKKYRPRQLDAQWKSSCRKILENLMVEFAGLPDESLAICPHT